MAAKAAKKKSARTGRNDPCPCGSGKKYKECHLPLEEEARREQMLLRQAQDLVLPKIIAAAQELPEQFPAAFTRFWQGKYPVEQLADLDTLEDRGAERFLTWFAFDVRQPNGQTLVAQLATTEGFAADRYEQRLLELWQPIRMRAYVIDEVVKGQFLLVHELFEGAQCRLADSHAAKRLAPGEVIVGHLAPAETPSDATEPTYYLAGAAAQLTADTAESLLAFAELHLADLRRTNPDATWIDLLNQRSEVLNHFVMALPTEEPDPTIFQTTLNQAMLNLRLTAESVTGLLGRPFTLPARPDEEDLAQADGTPEGQAGGPTEDNGAEVSPPNPDPTI